eukprot:gene16866-biopygen4643
MMASRVKKATEHGGTPAATVRPSCALVRRMPPPQESFDKPIPSAPLEHGHEVKQGEVSNLLRQYNDDFASIVSGTDTSTRFPLPLLAHLIGDMLPLPCPRLTSLQRQLFLRPMVLLQNVGRSHRARFRGGVSGVGARSPRSDDLLEHEGRHRAVRDTCPERLQRLKDVRGGGGERGLNLPSRLNGAPANPEQRRLVVCIPWARPERREVVHPLAAGRDLCAL